MFTGLLVDKMGVAKSIRLGLFLSVISRAVLFSVTATKAGHISLLIMLLGIQPTANSLIYPVLMIGIRRYTISTNRGFAYGLFYAVMNVRIKSCTFCVAIIILAIVLIAAHIHVVSLIGWSTYLWTIDWYTPKISSRGWYIGRWRSSRRERPLFHMDSIQGNSLCRTCSFMLWVVSCAFP